MGAEYFEGRVKASSNEMAVKKYKEIAPTNPCDYFGNYINITKAEVKLYEETFQNYSDAISFLNTKIKKWDDHTAMVKCSHEEYAWAVLLPN